MYGILGFAHNNLDNLAILTEVLVRPQSREQLVLLAGGSKTGHINQVLLHHPQARKMFPAEVVGFGFLLLFLQSSSGLFLLLRLPSLVRRAFLWCNNLVLDVVVIVLPSTCGTQAVHVILDIVVAELTYLEALDSVLLVRRVW